jgi:hypothetical protein
MTIDAIPGSALSFISGSNKTPVARLRGKPSAVARGFDPSAQAARPGELEQDKIPWQTPPLRSGRHRRQTHDSVTRANAFNAQLKRSREDVVLSLKAATPQPGLRYDG